LISLLYIFKPNLCQFPELRSQMFDFVGVVFIGQLPVGPFDFFLGDPLLKTQNPIGIPDIRFIAKLRIRSVFMITGIITMKLISGISLILLKIIFKKGLFLLLGI